MYLYGYRANEVGLLSLPAVKKSLKISRCKITTQQYNSTRIALSRSLPVCFIGATPPRPDPGHPPSIVGGVIKRFGFEPPKVNRKYKRKMKWFVSVWCKKNLIPLTQADIPTVEEWLEGTPYSAARKAELLKTWKDCGMTPNVKNFKRVKSFIKDETYDEYKFPRLINSRIDEAKCYFGPIVQVISDRVFSHEFFIKKHPVVDRPKVIRDTLLRDGSKYVFTDYTSYEAHFTAEVMALIQFELFKYMLRNCGQEDWLAAFCLVMAGTNILQFKFFTAIIVACRMSGEMDTSLSNGFCNLMVFLFLCRENGATEVKGFVEGDDGLFRVTPEACAPTKEQFEDLGFTIKIGVTDQLSEASFCGQVYDMDDLVVVTNPLEVLSRVGWTSKRYVHCNDSTAMQLLRAKGFSLVYQYNGCPMLCALGIRLLELTSDVVIEDRIRLGMDLWERQKYDEALLGSSEWKQKEIGVNTRLLVEKLYGVSVADQLKWESGFATLGFGLHELPCIDQVPECWREYFENNSLEYKTDDPTWLLTDELALITLLKNYKCTEKFISSLSPSGG